MEKKKNFYKKENVLHLNNKFWAHVLLLKIIQANMNFDFDTLSLTFQWTLHQRMYISKLSSFTAEIVSLS